MRYAPTQFASVLKRLWGGHRFQEPFLNRVFILGVKLTLIASMSVNCTWPMRSAPTQPDLGHVRGVIGSRHSTDTIQSTRIYD